MIVNRSMPEACVIPQLTYQDIGEAVDWLCEVFGFSLRLRIANHRAQLDVGAGAVIVVEASTTDLHVHLLASFGSPLGVTVRVGDVDRHYERVCRSGAAILGPLTDYPYGERQYSCRDLGGYIWTFSQTIADVAPEAWGGSRV